MPNWLTEIHSGWGFKAIILIVFMFAILSAVQNLLVFFAPGSAVKWSYHFTIGLGTTQLLLATLVMHRKTRFVAAMLLFIVTTISLSGVLVIQNWLQLVVHLMMLFLISLIIINKFVNY